MKTTLYGAALLAVLTLPAAASEQYDRKIEQAAIKIVAAKMGGLRGGFGMKQQPRFVTVEDVTSQAPLLPDRAMGKSAPATPVDATTTGSVVQP